MNSNYRRFLFKEKHDFHIYFDEKRSGISHAHHHDFHHCVYVTQGTFYHVQGGETLVLQAGDCVFTPIGVEHSIQIFEDTKYYCLSFSQNIAEALFSHIPSLKRDFRNLSPIIKIPSELDGRLRHCFDCLQEEQAYEEDLSLHTAYYLTISALIMLLRKEFSAPAKGLPFLDPNASPTEAEIIRSIQHITANYDHPLTIDELARISTLSRSTFSKAFRRYTGKTVKTFITELRIKEATHMINTSTIPIHDIAEKVGYSDFSTFYRNFVQIVGISPSKYKESVAVTTGSSGEPAHPSDGVGHG